MVKRTRNKELLKRLETLEVIANRKCSETVFVDLKEWIQSSDSGRFINYVCRLLKNKSKDTTLIVDDLILETSMYLDTSILYNEDKESIKQFVNFAIAKDDISFMKKYIEVFETVFMADYSSYQDLQEKYDDTKSKLIKTNDFFQDFMEHFKLLSVEDLVERYKNQRFFKMIRSNTGETQK